MTELGENLAILLVRELETFEREIDLFADDERIWSTAPGCPNPAANSALHVAGNLRHYVGAVLGATGYVRNREREFALRSGTRGDVKEELRAANTASGSAGRIAKTSRIAARSSSFTSPRDPERSPNSRSRFLTYPVPPRTAPT